jgi:hypothetical protein
MDLEVKKMRTLVVGLSLVIFSFLASGCNRTLSVNGLAKEYSALLSSKSLADLSLSNIDKVKISIYNLPSSGLPIQSYNDKNENPNTFDITERGLFYSRPLKDNSMNLSYNLGLSGWGMSSGWTGGFALKKGLFSDKNGNYWLVGRAAYDYLYEVLGGNYNVTDGFRIDKVELHQGTLEIVLSPKVWFFKPFISQQIGISNFYYKGEQSGVISPSFNDNLFTSIGVEINLKDSGIILGIKSRTIPNETSANGFFFYSYYFNL